MIVQRVAGRGYVKTKVMLCSSSAMTEYCKFVSQDDFEKEDENEVKSEEDNNFELEEKSFEEVLDMKQIPDIFDSNSLKGESGDGEQDEKHDEEKEEIEFEDLHVKEELSISDLKVEDLEGFEIKEEDTEEEMEVCGQTVCYNPSVASPFSVT